MLYNYQQKILRKIIDFDFGYEGEYSSGGPKTTRVDLSPSKVYYGEVNDAGEPHGKGKLCECDPFNMKMHIHIGEFKNGKKDGKGKVYDPIHSSIEYGVWTEDKRKEDHGTYCGQVRFVHQTYAQDDNDKTYVLDRIFEIGEELNPTLSNTLDIVPNGEGEFLFGDRRKFVGTWSNGKMKLGKYMLDDKIIYEGIFIDGKPDIPNFGYDSEIDRVGFVND